jgi:DNA-directed RNA polymerase specialized sigma subunit
MTNTWHHQDPLQLSEDEWATLLKDPSIIDEIGQKMLTFVYSQPNHQSSATEIGEALGGVPQQRVTALNRRIARRIYKRLGKEPPKKF